jgi:hypothetical protein
MKHYSGGDGTVVGFCGAGRQTGPTYCTHHEGKDDGGRGYLNDSDHPGDRAGAGTASKQAARTTAGILHSNSRLHILVRSTSEYELGHRQISPGMK